MQAWLRRALSSLSGCLYPLCPSAKSFGRRRCVWHLPNETPSFTRSEFLGAESRSKKAPVPKDRNWYCVNKLHQSRSVGTGRDLKRTKQHPLAPAQTSFGLVSFIAGRFISTGFLMMCSEPVLNFSFRKKSCKRNRPFLMLACVKAEDCFGHFDPPPGIPFATRLAPSNAHPLCRSLASALKKRPGTSS